MLAKYLMDGCMDRWKKDGQMESSSVWILSLGFVRTQM